MKRERVGERTVISSHLTHSFEYVDEMGQIKWLDFMQKEKRRATADILKKVYTQTLAVIDYHLENLSRGYRTYMSVLYWDDIPWLLMAVFPTKEPNADFLFRGLLRTPLSYEHMHTHCADQRNLLPTLFSVTGSTLMEMYPDVRRFNIPDPFEITVRILDQMEIDHIRSMRIDRCDRGLTIVVRDPVAFGLIWQKQKHCAEPIAGLCGGCLQVAYCSKECAAENWTFHRHECPRNKK
jgi:hypothetical protein